REGINAWRGDACCTIPHSAAGNDADAADCCSTSSATGIGDAGQHTNPTLPGAPMNPSPAPAAAEGCCEGCRSSAGPQPLSLGVGRTNDADPEHRR
ncbi:MAG: hypothetical protein ABWX85_10610, partial [Arthrobacter sp.]